VFFFNLCHKTQGGISDSLKITLKEISNAASMSKIVSLTTEVIDDELIIFKELHRVSSGATIDPSTGLIFRR
jgi:hypothetical protein